VCFFRDARQTKATKGTGAKRRGTTFAVRREQTWANIGRLPCACLKTHGKGRLFAVRLPEKRTAMNGTFVVRLHKRTTKALFWLLVLVTLPCVFLKTHGKVTIAIYFFGFHV
jgi:hypothetical protein